MIFPVGNETLSSMFHVEEGPLGFSTFGTAKCLGMPDGKSSKEEFISLMPRVYRLAFVQFEEDIATILKSGRHKLGIAYRLTLVLKNKVDGAYHIYRCSVLAKMDGEGIVNTEGIYIRFELFDGVPVKMNPEILSYPSMSRMHELEQEVLPKIGRSLMQALTLTDSQRLILHHSSQGLSTQNIADKLKIKPITVRSHHMKKIKSGVSGFLELSFDNYGDVVSFLKNHWCFIVENK